MSDDIKMFDIVYADFSDGKVGSEQSGIHPYIIIQNNTGNKYCPTYGFILNSRGFLLLLTEMAESEGCL